MQIIQLTQIGPIYYFLWNLLAFFLVWFDKRQARKRRWRVRERTFFLCAFCLGALGVWWGMFAFRHKTKHRSFVLGIPALLVINIGFLYLLSHI